MSKIPHGIYDNRSTMRREVYHDGYPEGTRLVQWFTANLIDTRQEFGGMAGMVNPFGHYPDVLVNCEIAPQYPHQLDQKKLQQ